jgi:uncharacterized membrane protein YgcG
LRLFINYFFFILISLGLYQAKAFDVPALRESVTDQAGFIEPTTKDKLSNALQEIYTLGGPQLAVLTVDTIEPLTIEEASYKVAKSWKLGTT